MPSYPYTLDEGWLEVSPCSDYEIRVSRTSRKKIGRGMEVTQSYTTRFVCPICKLEQEETRHGKERTCEKCGTEYISFGNSLSFKILSLPDLPKWYQYFARKRKRKLIERGKKVTANRQVRESRRKIENPETGIYNPAEPAPVVQPEPPPFQRFSMIDIDDET